MNKMKYIYRLLMVILITGAAVEVTEAAVEVTESANNDTTEYFGRYTAMDDAKYSCKYTDNRNRHITCNLPSAKDIDDIIAEYSKGAEDRLQAYNKIMNSYENLSDRLYQISLEESSDSQFSHYYLQLSKRVLEEFTKEKKEWGINPSVVSKNTKYLNLLEKLKELLMVGSKESKNKNFREFMTYHAPFTKVKDKVRRDTSFLKKYMKISIPEYRIMRLGRYFTFSKKCRHRKLKNYHREIFQIGPNLDVLMEKNFIKKILAGGKEKKPLRVNCVKTRKGKDFSVTYNPESHELKVPFRVKRVFEGGILFGEEHLFHYYFYEKGLNHITEELRKNLQ